MRKWTRFPTARRCGFCGKEIYPLQPAQLVMLGGLKHPKIRCVDCASDHPKEVMSLARIELHVSKLSTSDGQHALAGGIAHPADQHAMSSLREVAREWLPYVDK